jgi:hypothetical protein
VLHLGCGGESLPSNMQHCREIRVDIDPNCDPDIVADMAHLPEGIGPFDAAYASHSLEHLYPHEGDSCLAGVLRELKPGGAAIIRVPDLEDLSPTDEVLYTVPGGEVCAADLFYGWRPFLKERPYMAHRTGFVQATLQTTMERAGFAHVQVTRLPNWELIGIGVRP